MTDKPKNTGPVILIVDDDHDTLEMYEHLNLQSGDRVIISDGPEDAHKHLSRRDYKVDAVVTDLSMSPTSGITLTQQIREQEMIRSKSTPIKVFWATGYPVDMFVREMQEDLHVVKVFEKPISPQDIIDSVRECIRCPAARDCGG